MIDLGEAEAVDLAVTDFKKAVADFRDKEGKALAAASDKLYSLVFGPIRPLLGAAKEIFISPDGNLNLIPFEAVMTPEGRYLIEDYTFNYLTSGRDAMRFDRPVSGSPGPAVLMGDPDFDLAEEGKREALARIGAAESDPDAPPPVEEKPRGLRNIAFSRLAGTRDEVLAIKEVLDQAQVYLGPDVLEETLYKLEDPAILHLATHGFFLPDLGQVAPAAVPRENPLRRSGLALAGANLSLKADAGASDGILTAEKVLGLKLRDTEMVVLSACETGLGEVEAGEGVYGLRRAFTQAGANSLVMSMWSVPDLETKELMTEFYKNHQAGLKKPEALRAAALKMKQTARNRYGSDHPFFWAAFVFMGKP
jgi:CHAT domain-containing protein